MSDQGQGPDREEPEEGDRGYTRLSQETGTSIEDQKESIEETADRLDLDLVEILDDGRWSSGFDPERSEYQRLKDLIRSGHVGAVIVHNKKRIGRDFDERMMFLHLLRRNDVKLYSALSGEIDLSNPTDVAVEGIHAARDHEDAEERIEKSRRAVQERIENGFYQGGEPFGLEFDDEGEMLVPDENFDHAIEVIRLRDRGESYRSIRDKLDMENPPALGTIKNILDRKPRYLSYQEAGEVLLESGDS